MFSVHTKSQSRRLNICYFFLNISAESPFQGCSIKCIYVHKQNTNKVSRFRNTTAESQFNEPNDLFFVKDDLINMSRAWNKEKIWVPDRNRTQDLPNTTRVLYPLRSWLLSDDSKSVQKQCSWFVLVKTEKHSDQTTKLSLPRSLWTWFDRHLQHNFGSRVLTRRTSRRPVEGHLLKNIVLFFICCFINCSLEQAL